MAPSQSYTNRRCIVDLITTTIGDDYDDDDDDEGVATKSAVWSGTASTHRIFLTRLHISTMASAAPSSTASTTASTTTTTTPTAPNDNPGDADSLQGCIAVITGDVGGTNARFQLHTAAVNAARSPASYTQRWSQTYNSFTLQGLSEGLQFALRDANAAAPTGVRYVAAGEEHGATAGDGVVAVPVLLAAMAVCGPVKQGKAEMENLGWNEDEAVLSKELGLPVALLNDFVALVCGGHCHPTPARTPAN